MQKGMQEEETTTQHNTIVNSGGRNDSRDVLAVIVVLAEADKVTRQTNQLNDVTFFRKKKTTQ